MNKRDVVEHCKNAFHPAPHPVQAYNPRRWERRQRRAPTAPAMLNHWQSNKMDDAGPDNARNPETNSFNCFSEETSRRRPPEALALFFVTLHDVWHVMPFRALTKLGTFTIKLFEALAMGRAAPALHELANTTRKLTSCVINHSP